MLAGQINKLAGIRIAFGVWFADDPQRCARRNRRHRQFQYPFALRNGGSADQPRPAELRDALQEHFLHAVGDHINPVRGGTEQLRQQMPLPRR